MKHRTRRRSDKESAPTHEYEKCIYCVLIRHRYEVVVHILAEESDIGHLVGIADSRNVRARCCNDPDRMHMFGMV